MEGFWISLFGVVIIIFLVYEIIKIFKVMYEKPSIKDKRVRILYSDKLTVVKMKSPNKSSKTSSRYRKEPRTIGSTYVFEEDPDFIDTSDYRNINIANDTSNFEGFGGGGSFGGGGASDFWDNDSSSSSSSSDSSDSSSSSDSGSCDSGSSSD